MHECWICGRYCDCDGEDHDQPQPDDCDCPCWQEEEATTVPPNSKAQAARQVTEATAGMVYNITTTFVSMSSATLNGAARDIPAQEERG